MLISEQRRYLTIEEVRPFWALPLGEQIRLWIYGKNIHENSGNGYQNDSPVPVDPYPFNESVEMTGEGFNLEIFRDTLIEQTQDKAFLLPCSCRRIALYSFNRRTTSPELFLVADPS
jgi:hypothetical protein